jgi:hypothetical protein
VSLIDIVGWIGNIGFIFGAIYLAKKSVWGFYWQIFGNAFYLVQALMLGVSSLMILSIILIGINIFAIYNWLKRG